MDIATILSLGQTALELGLICSLTVLALYLSYSMLNVCDLSTCRDGRRRMLGLCHRHIADKARR